jgi:Ca2+-transporting ATPase
MPILQNLFKTVPLTLDEWMPVAGFSLLAPVVSSFFKGIKKRDEK